MRQWEEEAVEAWHDADWMEIDRTLAARSARVVGAHAHEVAVGGTLTGNLHVLMASFFRPAGDRTKILMEAGAFPSDRYAAAGQLGWHGLDPASHLLEAPDTESLLSAIEKKGQEIALVLLAGINYYDGRCFDMAAITRAAQARGAVMGLDLAHAAGNVPLRLHEWGPDFAAWCGYKYLNGGPGAPAGLFVHERHHDTSRPRLAGWWGHDLDTRFAMPARFKPAAGAAGWQISTPPVLGLAPLEASLAMFDEAGMDRIARKSAELTGFLETELGERLAGRVEILTPAARGAQLSLRVAGGKAVFERLGELGVVCDWREPDVIRVAPAPLYNRFSEMIAFVDRLEQALDQSSRM